MQRFELEGLQVSWCRRLSEAREALSFLPSAVVSDVRLPDGLATEWFVSLPATVRALPWFFLTGYGSVNDAVAAVRAGAREYLTKPFDIESLVAKIKDVMTASGGFGTVIGFVHFFVMLLTLTIYANLIQLSPNYMRAAQDLGASKAQVFRHVVLPLTLPGVVTGAFLTFVLCIGDYITPQILGGNAELTLPQLIMLQLGRSGNFPLASALSVVLMAVVTLAYAGCSRWLRLDRL